MTVALLGEVSHLVIHHTMTPASRNIGAEELDALDRKRGFRTIGYHYVIRRDGTVEPGRPENEPGVHSPGFDRCSVSIALVGGAGADGATPEDNDTPEQRAALAALIAELEVRHPGAQPAPFRELQAQRKAAA